MPEKSGMQPSLRIRDTSWRIKIMTNEQLKIIGHRVRIISKSSAHKGEYGIVTGTTKNREWLKVRLSNSTIKVAFSSVMQIN